MAKRHGSWWKRFLHFCSDNLLYIVVGSIFLIATVLGIVLLSKLDPYHRLSLLANALIWIPMGALNTILFVIFLYWLHYGGGSFAKLVAKGVNPAEVGVHWDDVVGMEEAKQEAMEVVNLIKDRTKIKKIGGKVLRGILMVGPPGCGKTYLAKAIATESGLPFLSISGSEFVEIFVGVGASRMRKLFKTARRLADEYGGCIIFIDEIDAVARRRVFSVFGGTEETNSTQNQLLAEMDGLKSDDKYNIVVIGATNASEETLDPALLRPGRFDRKIYIDRPSLQDREKLFAYYLSKVKHDPDIDVGRLARRAVYKSPAEISNIVREATMIALRNGKEGIGWKELSEAMERIDLGIKHRTHLTPQEKERVAYHEAGHLVVMYLLHPTDDVFKASIISRRHTLGVVYHQPREEFYTSDKERILANIKVAMGGYTAEKIRFGTTSDGVGGDFHHATQLAHRMVWQLGMNSLGIVGDISALPSEHLSEELKAKLNNDMQSLLSSAQREVEDLLNAERPILDRFARELIAKEELEYDEIERIFAEYGKTNPRFSPNT